MTTRTAIVCIEFIFRSTGIKECMVFWFENKVSDIRNHEFKNMVFTPSAHMRLYLNAFLEPNSVHSTSRFLFFNSLN